MMTGAASAGAQSSAPPATAGAAGEDMYQRARATWARRKFAASEPLYKEALSLGQLPPDETLDCYIHLGAARAMMKKKEGALAAFREAALIDPKFAVPAEASKRALPLAARAKRDEAQIGPVSLTADAPDSSVVGSTIKVQANLDPAHAAIFARIGILARDLAADTVYSHSEPAGTLVNFEVPANVATAKGTIIVRIAALDVHDNRLVSVERKVNIEAAAPPLSAPALAVTDLPKLKKADDVRREQDRKAGGGFWSTPWPYVVGGVALAAGGAAVFFATRSSDAVSVGAPRVAVR